MEFILNIRDLDASVPVIVMGQPGPNTTENQLKIQNYTSLLEMSLRDQRDVDQTTTSLKHILDVYTKQTSDIEDSIMNDNHPTEPTKTSQSEPYLHTATILKLNGWPNNRVVLVQ